MLHYIFTHSYYEYICPSLPTHPSPVPFLFHHLFSCHFLYFDSTYKIKHVELGMAQCIKHLLCKCEDLSLNPRFHVKSHLDL